jgi:hypothetical protein
MKCLKNTKTGNIIRVSDIQANQMAGNTWKYTTKTEWKGVVSESPKENVEVGNNQDEIKKEKKSKKVLK